MTTPPLLAVLGAGPKALAVAAKHAALAACGHDVPDLLLIDEAGPAAHWDGSSGYTDGRPRLGTPPLKDLGFPYPDAWGGSSTAVSEWMGRLSWPSYLIATGRYAEWVDRGLLHPHHEQWADYLRWAARRLDLQPAGPEAAVESQGAEPRRAVQRRAAVTGLGLHDGRWTITLLETTDTAARSDQVVADGLLITGPGPPVTLPGQTRHPRVLDGASLWTELATLGEPGPSGRPPGTVAVVGSGETAAAVAVALTTRLPGARIEIVTSDGVLHTRGESHTENALYSDPTGWLLLPERARQVFLRGTDRGVFSTAAQQALDGSDQVHTVLGRVTRLHAGPPGGDDGVTLHLHDGSDDPPTAVVYDLVVVCVGFDPLWWLALDDGSITPALEHVLDGAVEQAGQRGSPRSRTALRRGVERAIGRLIDTDLTVAGLDAPLHLPMLAGLAQGPGFPNLSCLGLLADRVLRPYVAPRQRHPQRSGCATASPVDDQQQPTARDLPR